MNHEPSAMCTFFMTVDFPDPLGPHRTRGHGPIIILINPKKAGGGGGWGIVGTPNSYI